MKRRARAQPEVARMPTSSFPVWRMAGIVLAGLVVYANSLGGPFVFDDMGTIVQNPTIRAMGTAWHPPASTAVAGRPVVNISFAMNYFAGQLDVAGYHAVNIGLHIVCALLIFGILRRTLGRMPADDPSPTIALMRRHATDVSTAIALLWIVHPLNSEVVDYLTQRTESAMGVCLLLTMYASVRALEGGHRRQWTIAAVLGSAVGMACKETMAVVPLAVVLYDRVFEFRSTPLSQQLRSRGPLYGGLAATWLIVGALVVGNGQTFGAGFATARISPWLYFLNQPVMMVRYLRLAVWPDSLVLYYGWPQPVTMAQVWPQFGVMIGLAAVTLWALVRAPRAGFLGAWCFLLLAPTSSFIPIATEVGAERRMYLPMAALVALAVTGATALWARHRSLMPSLRRSAAPALPPSAMWGCVAVAAVLATLTIVRTREYASPLTMAQTILARWPTPNAEYLVGTQLAAAGRQAAAVTHLRAASLGYAPARFDLGSTLIAAGQVDEGIATLQAFVRDEPRLLATRSAHLLMARAFAARNQPDQAIDELQQVLVVDASDPDAHGLLADLMAGQQNFSGAIPHYRAFVSGRPNEAAGWTGLGIALIASGEPGPAADAFRQAAALHPGNAPFRTNFARALLESGQTSAGATEAEQAVRLAPADAAAYEVLGRARLAQRRPDDARRAFEQALRINPGYVPAIDGLRALMGR